METLPKRIFNLGHLLQLAKEWGVEFKDFLALNLGNGLFTRRDLDDIGHADENACAGIAFVFLADQLDNRRSALDC